MSWDHKPRGPACGYFYLSKRVPGKPHPVKLYLGRKDAAHEVADEVERRAQERRAARQINQDDREATAEAVALADELFEYTKALSAAWLTLTGHHHHRGQWRRRHGQ